MSICAELKRKWFLYSVESSFGHKMTGPNSRRYLPPAVKPGRHSNLRGHWGNRPTYPDLVV